MPTFGLLLCTIGQHTTCIHACAHMHRHACIHTHTHVHKMQHSNTIQFKGRLISTYLMKDDDKKTLKYLFSIIESLSFCKDRKIKIHNMQSLVCAEVSQCLMVSVADSRQSLKGTRAAVRSNHTWIHCVFDFELILLIVHSETCYHYQMFSEPSIVAPGGVTTHGLRRVLTEEASVT